MFNPDRLSLARRRRGLTQIGLASALGVARLTVYRYESGQVDPPEHVLDKCAAVLKFPVSFFCGPTIEEPNPQSASFRGLTEMTARERDAALAGGALGFLLDDWVNERFRFPEPNIPDLSGEEPEVAARLLRQELAIGDRPIKSMVRLLEAIGVRVFSLAEETRSVDAFSLWRRGGPYVFLNTFKTTERSRYDAAHELGHLALHKHGGPAGRKAEEEANQFASAFLMPEADVTATCRRISNVQQILSCKGRWGVAAVALNFRLHKLDCISPWLYRQFAIQLTKLGFRTAEPGGLAPEKSAIWQQVFDSLRAEGKSKHKIAEEVDLPAFEIENLLFQLANWMTLDGGGTGSGKARGQLRLIENE
ncbi:MAG TPA: XRE family transcriptional regulator [Steroidobacteraceae bacterium]|jgi:Zn-dependent peptidase ImmA (M78 family)/DNA-binding XRE family transcriptional regulator|nr:XRE family transcriptional regulator [Steroidobacteraceae bacterium]